MRLNGTAQAEIDAPRERCFAVLTDFERYPEWYGCDRATIVGRNPPVVELVYEIPVLEIAVTLRFNPTPPTSLQAELVAANSRIKDLRMASWLLEELPEGRTRASYSVDLEVSVPLPLRAVAAGRGRDLLIEQPVAELKQRLEA